MNASRSHGRLAILAVVLALPVCRTQVARAQQRQGAAVSGTVRDSTGRPVADADVGVMGAGMRARSDTAGVYRIINLMPGRAMLTVRRLGFVSETRQVRLLENETRRVDFVLAAAAHVLDVTTVVAPREASDARLAGFNERSKQQVGHFVTRDRIDRANSATLVDVLREIPGMRIGGQGSQGRLVRIRSNSCPPLVFVDGVPASAGEFDLDMVDLATVQGIEVYSGLGSLPAEFSGPRDLDRCGVIAIWSRPAPARAPRRAPSAPEAVVVAVPETFNRDEVDVGAIADSGMRSPEYPDSLLRAGTAGRVVVEFVVDTTGRVDPGSVEAMQATDPRFAAAVREALLASHFQPALRRGRRVRQYVQLPFAFAPERRLPTSAPPS